ncbi:MAG: transporter related [Herminiimonas sp.]|nr:transporter related [Herminiimonas sp.]
MNVIAKQNAMGPSAALPAGGRAPGGAGVLTCEKVSARYGRIGVCFDVDLQVSAGEMVALLGPNGAGKSSLLGAIAGLVQSSGTVNLGSECLSALPAHRRAGRGLAFVPEIRGNTFSSLSVDENLQLGMRLLAPAERPGMLKTIFDLFPVLTTKLDAASGMLSGGEQQMLAIGMALGSRPSALLLDEPTQGLAPAVYDILEAAFTKLKRNGLAILLAEQNLPFAARVADRFVVLSHGRTTLRGDAAQLKNHEMILAAYLDDADAGTTR